MPTRRFLPPTLYELQELRSSGAVTIALQGLATGIISGLIIGAFRMAFTFANEAMTKGFLKHQGSFEGYVLTVLGLFFFATIAWLAVRHEPLISGSGIPHVELVLKGKLPMPWLRILWTKFFGTLASLCGGLAVGREGPCIQMGAAVGCGVGRIWHDNYLRPRFLVGGSTAGMTAAFGAPLAGLLFAFEELHAIISVPMLLFTGIAALGAWFMVDIILQLGLVFPLADTPFNMTLFWYAPLMGLVCGVISAGYNVLLTNLTFLADKSGIKQPWRIYISFLLAGTLIYTYPHVITGLGPTMTNLAAGGQGLPFLVALWCVRVLFNCTSFASGVSGGLLMPMLLAGGITGAILAAGAETIGVVPLHAASVIIGMACLFAGTVRSPLCGAFLITEMTGAWQMLPILVVAAFISAYTADSLGSRPVYDVLRYRQLRNYKIAHSPKPLTGEVER